MSIDVRMAKWIYILIGFLCAGISLKANPITRKQAEDVAKRFWSQRLAGRGLPAQAITPRLLKEGEKGGYYMFSSSSQDQFVLVSGDDRFPEILAYGQLAFAAVSDMPKEMNRILIAYDDITNSESSYYTQRQQGATVPPLLQSVRHQDGPYNGMCPYYTYSDGRVSDSRCVVGCVATALEQIMTYHQHPIVLKDTLFGWSTSNYTIADVLPGTQIDWANILPSYDGNFTQIQAQAVQEVSLYCGMAVQMQYGVSSSGAQMWRAVESLHRVFDYKYVRFNERFYYSPQQWNNMIRHELEQGRPIAYAGYNVEASGHAFVVDGVDADGFYHVNWGYGGAYDGWFDLDVLNSFEDANDVTPSGIHEGFFCNQSVIFMHPEEQIPYQADTLVSFRPEDVRVDSVVFARNPDTKGYVAADFYFTNLRPDTISYSFEVMTNLETDTARFAQAEYVAISGVTLLPNSQTKATAYCSFRREGKFLLGYSYDGINIPYSMPVTVRQGYASNLGFGELIQRPAELSTTAKFTLPITNQSVLGYDGSLVTYCLFKNGQMDDLRHWSFLNLSPGEQYVDTITFKGLELGVEYTLKVRCPWMVVSEKTFVLDESTQIFTTSDVEYVGASFVYDLQGRLLFVADNRSQLRLKLKLLPKGIYVVHYNETGRSVRISIP